MPIYTRVLVHARLVSNSHPHSACRHFAADLDLKASFRVTSPAQPPHAAATAASVYHCIGIGTALT